MRGLKVEFMIVHPEKMQESTTAINEFLATRDVSQVQLVQGYKSVNGAAYYPKVMVVYREVKA